MQINNCEYYLKICKPKTACRFIQEGRVEDCALYGLLKEIEKAKKEKNYDKKDMEIISEFERQYINKWIESDSPAKGRATGAGFENFIIKMLKKYGKIEKEISSNKRVPIVKGVTFLADIVYKEDDSIKALIEAKVYIDLQHALAFIGLLTLTDYRVALVTAYPPKENVVNILSHIQEEMYPKRFNYFCVIEKPWEAIKDLIDFIKES